MGRACSHQVLDHWRPPGATFSRFGVTCMCRLGDLVAEWPPLSGSAVTWDQPCFVQTRGPVGGGGWRAEPEAPEVLCQRFRLREDASRWGFHCNLLSGAPRQLCTPGCQHLDGTSALVIQLFPEAHGICLGLLADADAPACCQMLAPPGLTRSLGPLPQAGPWCRGETRQSVPHSAAHHPGRKRSPACGLWSRRRLSTLPGPQGFLWRGQPREGAAWALLMPWPLTGVFSVAPSITHWFRTSPARHLR